MSNAALASNIVNLDEYRRSRGDKKQMQPRHPAMIPAFPATPAVWVYWVPVWVW